MSAPPPKPDRHRDARAPILLVDPTGNPWRTQLAAELADRGFEPAVVGRPEEIKARPALRHPFVVVYSPPPSTVAERTVAAVADRLDPAIVVLVDESDFSHYYWLMSLGVRGYFALSEGIDSIARAVAILARDRAEPPRRPAASVPRLLRAAPAA